MDQNQSNGSTSSSRTSYWTNERHGHFLNSLEASFVRNMFGKHDVDDEEDRRLDRVLPDSAESTLDLGSGNGRRRGHSSTGLQDILRKRVDADKATRRPSSKSFTSNQDQVVPQLKYGKEDKDAENNVDASQDRRRQN
nr:Protein Rev like [Ipomoea batatas]